jgi:ribosomal 50S subunit-associated protein YjgA (DUF615 family)
MQHRLISDTETDEQVNAWAMDLFWAVNKAAAGRPLEAGIIAAIEELIKHETQLARRRGLKIPELVVIPLVRQSSVEIFRKDLDTAGVANVITRLAAKYPGITEAEIAWAVRKAWPDYQRRLM